MRNQVFLKLPLRQSFKTPLKLLQQQELNADFSPFTCAQCFWSKTMHTRVRWQLLCRAGFPLERRVQGREHSVTLLKSAPLSCHPRVPQDLPALGTLGLAAGLGSVVMEMLTQVKLSVLMIPGTVSHVDGCHSDHQSWRTGFISLVLLSVPDKLPARVCPQRKIKAAPRHSLPSWGFCFTHCFPTRKTCHFFSYFLPGLPVYL